MRKNFEISSGCFIFSSRFLLLFSQLLQLLLPGTEAENRVINGTDVNPPHKYPWMVSLFFTCFPNGNCPYDHICGGAVLNDQYILTAAHCCYPENPFSPNVSIKHLYVVTGLHERSKLEPWSQNLSIADCTVHELYSVEGEDLHHDIALIRVNGRIAFSDKVTPLNLPSAGFDVETDGEAKATLIGWGQTDADSPGSKAKFLQQVELPMITTSTCQVRMGFTNFFNKNYSLPVTESMFCVGFVDGAKGACTADSGSPVMMLNQATNTYMLIGLVSWSIPPCASTYTVNVRVSSYLNWIKDHAFKCVPRIWGSSNSA